MIELVGLLAAACILSASVPQVIALVRHGAEGVSLGSWSLLLATSTVWAAYGFRIESPSTVAGNIGGAVAFTVVVALLLRARTGSAAAPVLIAPALAAVFAAAWWAPLGVTAVVAVGLGFSLAVPQLLASVRSWRAARESEVALGAWGTAAHRPGALVGLRRGNRRVGDRDRQHRGSGLLDGHPDRGIA